MAKDGSQPALYNYGNGSSGSGSGSGSTSSGSSGGLSAPSSSSVTMNVTESKIQYIRHMVYQYLSCRDAEAGGCISSLPFTILTLP